MSTRKRRRKQDAPVMISDVSPPQGLQLPSIDEYDLAGLFAQSMDDTLRLEKSDENVAVEPVTCFGNFGSIAGKLESFNSVNKKTLSTVPSEGLAALPPTGVSSTAVVPADAWEMRQLSGLTGVVRKVLFESRVKISKFDIFFEKFNFFIFQGNNKKLADSLVSYASVVTTADNAWGVIQIPGAFNTTGIVLLENNAAGPVCRITGLQLKSGSLSDALSAFGIENMTVHKAHGNLGLQESPSSDEEVEDPIPYASIEIVGRTDVFGFFNFLRSLLTSVPDSRKPTVLVASCPFRHAVAESPQVVAKKGASSTYIEMDHLIFPISIFGNLINPMLSSLVKLSISPDVDSFKAFNPNAILQKDNVISFSN